MTVLVTAASRHGSTAEIADAIAARLRERGLDVDRRRPEEVGALGDCVAVVLGSAVYAGCWLGPATRLVDHRADELAARPVWLFSSGPVGEPAVPGTEPDVTGLVARTHALDHRVFAGRLDRSGLGLAARAVVRVVKAPDGDFRDWDAIRAWAGEIADRLDAPAP